MLRFIYRLYQIYVYIVRPLTFGVRIMLVRDGKVLLVRQTYMEGWYIPGGGIKKGESLEQAARREAREEVQAELRSISLLGVYSNFKEWKSDHNILFVSNNFVLGGGHDNEIAEMRFFPMSALPAGLWPGHRKRLLEFQRDQKRRTAAAMPRFGEW